MTLTGNSLFSLKSCYRSFVSPALVVTALITLDYDWVPLLHWARNPAQLDWVLSTHLDSQEVPAQQPNGPHADVIWLVTMPFSPYRPPRPNLTFHPDGGEKLEALVKESSESTDAGEWAARAPPGKGGGSSQGVVLWWALCLWDLHPQ